MSRPAIDRPHVARRSILQFGGTALGLSLGGLLKARASAVAQEETSVIFVWLPGGPPHMEMYDLKPDAPSDYRGLFSPIPTKVAGLEVCELFPEHARIADKFNLIRSVHHEFADHGGGHKRFLTGRLPATPTGFVNDAPCVGSMAAKVLHDQRPPAGLPEYVVLGSGRVNSIDTFSFGSAYLAADTHPFTVSADPNADNFEVQNISVDQSMSDRLQNRMALLQGFDHLRHALDEKATAGSSDGMDVFHRRALSMLTSDKVRSAFDMSQESAAVRDRFGRHGWGQRALLARRLVERGVPWVTVVMENPYQSGITMPKFGCYNWDSHAVNAHIFDDARVRFPVYDRTITAMIEDLYQRGLDKRVMLVVTGEFGRTPRLSHRVGTSSKVMQPGRDHWPRAMSMLVSGGGMRTGQVIGSTNSRGEEPASRPLTPNDLWATVYRHLGIDYHQSFPDHSGRPMPMLPFGEPIAELI